MKKILLLLAQGFETYEASVFIDVLGWNLTDGDKNTRLLSCGLTAQVKTSFDQVFVPDMTIDEVGAGEFDALAIPGGFEEYGFYQDAYDEKFLGVIRQFHEQGKVIASVCVGALPVGKSGILAGKNATVYPGIRQDQLRGFGVNVVDAPVVLSDNVITSWNPSTAMTVAFMLLESLTSARNDDHIKCIMGFS